MFTMPASGSGDGAWRMRRQNPWGFRPEGESPIQRTGGGDDEGAKRRRNEGTNERTTEGRERREGEGDGDGGRGTKEGERNVEE